MPNRVLAHALRGTLSLLDKAKQSAFDYLLVDTFGPEIEPFQIHHTVELRNSDQIKLGVQCRIQPRVILNGRSNLKDFGVNFGPETYLKENCYFDAYGGFIEIEGQCAFAQNTIIHGGGGVRIGRRSIFGANCYIIASNHSFGSRELPTMLQGDVRKGISIGENVWVGGNVTILDGVNIGRNCVIGAGTLVTKSVPENSVVFNKIEPVMRKVYNDRDD